MASYEGATYFWLDWYESLQLWCFLVRSTGNLRQQVERNVERLASTMSADHMRWPWLMPAWDMVRVVEPKSPFDDPRKT